MDMHAASAAVARAATPPADSAAGPASAPLHLPVDLAQFIGDDDWAVYRAALNAVQRLGIEFALGGGLAVSFYTGLWRGSKDIDIYVEPRHRAPVIEALGACGLADLHAAQPYDRGWIYRATRDGVIVDVIWAMANGAGPVEHDWIACAAPAPLRGEAVCLLAPEELLWSKVHVLQKDRCDWPDLVNLLYAAGPHLRWPRLLARFAARGEQDLRLLASLLSLFAWLAPGQAAQLPAWLWARLGLPPPRAPGAPAFEAEHVRLLDSRSWFVESTAD